MDASPKASLVERLLGGDRTALARMITWAENSDPRFPAAASELHPRVGRAWRLGVTGPPGAGKSTLVNELVRAERAAGHTVGVLAVDPSSPLTGGALLGDRIRMEERTLDPGVFIRSMASRGSHGGIAAAAVDACDAMDAFGLERVVLETVGVGQAEYDVVAAADTVLVVLCPGAGDGVQAMKAGLLEVADVLVVNKADVPGADRLVCDLEEAVHVRQAGRQEWITPVVTCSAGRGEGVEDVLAAAERHRAHLEDGRLEAARLAKRVDQVRRVVAQRLGERLWGLEDAGPDAVPGPLAERTRALLEAGRAPYDIAHGILRGLAAALDPLDPTSLAAAPPPASSGTARSAPGSAASTPAGSTRPEPHRPEKGSPRS